MLSENDNTNTEAQLKEARSIMDNIQTRTYGGVDIRQAGKNDGENGRLPTMPEFLVYWIAWCEGYRTYVLNNPEF